MCCLEYENYYYSDAFKKVPKVGSTVETPDGKGTVVSNNMLTMVVKVKIVGSDGQEVLQGLPAFGREIPAGERPGTGKRGNSRGSERNFGLKPLTNPKFYVRIKEVI